MKIAVVTNDGKVISLHFGQARQFAVFTIEDGQVSAQEVREKPSHRYFVPASEGRHERRAGNGSGRNRGTHGGFALMMGAIDDCEIVIARGMGAGMYHNLKQAGLSPILTPIVEIDEAVTAYLEGRLEDHPERVRG